MKVIDVDAWEYGKRTEVHSFAHWDGHDHYINGYEGSMAVLRYNEEEKGVSIERVPVGTDDVLFARYARQ